MDPNINLFPHEPPPLPSDATYTSCYCEENVYLLAQGFSASFAARTGGSPIWGVYVIFISNHDKRVALWDQKARDGVVVWDYHVILVLRKNETGHTLNGLTSSQTSGCTWVYDFDSRLSMPCHWKDYMTGTFPYTSPTSGLEVHDEYVSMFRVISAEEYLANFASDRSHMIRVLGDGTIHYVSPPPTYKAVCGPGALAQGIKNNLMSSFVTMRSQSQTSVSQEKGADVTKASTVEEWGEIEGPKCKLGGRGKESCGYGVVMRMSDFLSWLSS